MAGRLILDSHKLNWHYDRFMQWLQGERIPPITIDWALSSRCNYRCGFCAAQGQTGKKDSLPEKVIFQAIEDMAIMGVRGLVFMSDGESTLSRYFTKAVIEAKTSGLSVGLATNGYLVGEKMAEAILPCLDYLRINFSAGDPRSYARIMGVSEKAFHRVRKNVAKMVEIKKKNNLTVTLNLQMVLHPSEKDQILPFVELAKELGVDYAIIKHCLDYRDGQLQVDYQAYQQIEPLLRQAEAMTTPDFLVAVKWSKIKAGKYRSYQKCYGPPFLLQISGTGLVAACGPLFSSKYGDKYHIGNINKTRLIDLWRGERYWEVMNYLRGEEFDTERECGGYGCVQDGINRAIDNHLKGIEKLQPLFGPPPLHVNFC